jgi:hypothetical protein
MFLFFLFPLHTNKKKSVPLLRVAITATLIQRDGLQGLPARRQSPWHFP